MCSQQACIASLSTSCNNAVILSLSCYFVFTFYSPIHDVASEVEEADNSLQDHNDLYVLDLSK